MKYLLSEDSDPFLVDRAHLRTALHCAAAYGHAPVLRALLADDLLVCWDMLIVYRWKEDILLVRNSAVRSLVV